MTYLLVYHHEFGKLLIKSDDAEALEAKFNLDTDTIRTEIIAEADLTEDHKRAARITEN